MTLGLEGRDDEERAALQRIAARDEEAWRGGAVGGYAGRAADDTCHLLEDDEPVLP